VWYSWRVNNAGRLAGTVSLAPLRIFAKPILALKPDTVPFFIPYYGFGVWHTYAPEIQIAVYNPDLLPPLEFPEAQPDLESDSVRIIAMITPHAAMSIPKLLPPGTHHIDFPGLMKSLHELLFIGDYQLPVDNQSFVNEDIPYAVYQLNPASCTITIHPLHFFNSTNFDLSTQRPARVARDPDTGNFIIDGFGIDPFEIPISM
jgi:hypothetical protein